MFPARMINDVIYHFSKTVVAYIDNVLRQTFNDKLNIHPSKHHLQLIHLQEKTVTYAPLHPLKNISFPSLCRWIATTPLFQGAVYG